VKNHSPLSFTQLAKNPRNSNNFLVVIKRSMRPSIGQFLVALLFSRIDQVPAPSTNIENTLTSLKASCEEAAKSANAGGQQLKKCLKESRIAAREKHAEGLRVILQSELAMHHQKGADVVTKPSQPHILLVTTDQQRRDSIGAYARLEQTPTSISTPHLDRLAREGCMVFDAYSAAPVCAPSRTSLLLGVHVPVHGVFENGLGAYNPQLVVPFVDLLSGVAASPSSIETTASSASTSSSSTSKSKAKGSGGGSNGGVKEGLGYATALIGKAGFTPMPKGFSHVNVQHGEGANEARASGTAVHDYLETYLVNCSMVWILETMRLEPRKPWFLHLSLSSPHPPNTVPQGWPVRYHDDDDAQQTAVTTATGGGAKSKFGFRNQTRRAVRRGGGGGGGNGVALGQSADEMNDNKNKQGSKQEVGGCESRSSGCSSSSFSSSSSLLPALNFLEGDFEALPVQTKILQGMVDPPLPKPLFTSASLPTPTAVMMEGAAALDAATAAAAAFAAASPREEWVGASRAFPAELRGAADVDSINSSRRNSFNQAAFVDDQVECFLSGSV
jgi:hypothetical protein